MEDYPVKLVLRGQAWERAKGELNAVLASFTNEREAFERCAKHFRQFIDETEDNGIAE